MAGWLLITNNQMTQNVTQNIFSCPHSRHPISEETGLRDRGECLPLLQISFRREVQVRQELKVATAL